MATPDDGFLTRCIAWTRKWADEPSTDPKYTDADIITLLEGAYAQVLHEVNRVDPHPITARFDASLTGCEDDDIYVSLPVGMGKILRMEYLDSDKDLISVVESRGILHPWGPGFEVQGNTLCVREDAFDEDNTIRFEYAPLGCAHLVEGTIDDGDYDGTALTVAVGAASGYTNVNGQLDIRDNAYAGSIFRVLGTDDGGGTGTNVGQERIIESWDASALEFTLTHALDTAPVAGDTLTFEVGPVLPEGLDMVIALRAAMNVLGVEGTRSRLASMRELYATHIRDVRLSAGQRHTYDNEGLRKNLGGRRNTRGPTSLLRRR